MIYSMLLTTYSIIYTYLNKFYELTYINILIGTYLYFILNLSFYLSNK